MTPVQLRLMNFICDYTDENAISPSFDGMREGLDLASKSGVHRIVHALEEERWISLPFRGSRNITILRRPLARDPYAIDRLAALDLAKFEKLAQDIITLQARRAA